MSFLAGITDWLIHINIVKVIIEKIIKKLLHQTHIEKKTLDDASFTLSHSHIHSKAPLKNVHGSFTYSM